MPPLATREALFRKALDRYLNGPAAYTQEALKEPTARAVVERLLLGAADLNTARAIRVGASWCKVRLRVARRPIPSGRN